jgi:2-polyprenyl-3-methyl-5-hydroxy-6-metoxy-1,4-benzoquinol methylase
MNPPPSSQWLKEIYKISGHALTAPISLSEVMSREAKFPNSTIDAARLAKNVHFFNQSGNWSALDIGSGYGFFTRALKDVGFTTTSINPGTYENTVFEELNGTKPLPVMLEDFEASNKFGVVLISQVLEHIVNPTSAVTSINSLLDRKGVVACAVPNINSFSVKLFGTKDNSCLWVPEHVNYFSSRGLRILFERNGFSVLKLEYITRLPTNPFSRRFNRMSIAASALDKLTNKTQNPIKNVLNKLGLGLHINMYAIKL